MGVAHGTIEQQNKIFFSNYQKFKIETKKIKKNKTTVIMDPLNFLSKNVNLLTYKLKQIKSLYMSLEKLVAYIIYYIYYLRC